MTRPRYCYETERPSRNRFLGAPFSFVNHNERLRGGVYTIYDRQRGLYDAICYVPDRADAEKIVDALNRAEEEILLSQVERSVF